MGFLPLFIAALAASAVSAADPCACVNPDQKIDSINNPMIFFQQPTEGGVLNGKTCSMKCSFKASLDKDDPAYSLQIQILTNKLGDGSISIGGMDGSVTTITSNTATGVLPQKSYGDSITLDFSEESSNLGEFMLVVQKVAGRPDAPVVKPTTTAVPTPPYDAKYIHNPRLVANDIMLAFDLSSNNLDKFKTFAQDLIKELSILPKAMNSDEDEDCGAGSRLSLVGLSGLNGFDNLYAPYWTTSYTQADGNINSFVQISDGRFYFGPVDSKYVYGFDKAKDAAENDAPYTACKNRGKLFILLTSSQPMEYDTTLGNGGPNVPVTDFLTKFGVHQILVHYNMKEDDKKFYNLFNKTDDSNVWNFFPLGGVDKDVESFINTYLVDSSDQMTCQLKAKTAETEVPIGADKPDQQSTPPTVSVSIPPYYKAKGVDGGDWETVRHYCNFQETTVKLVRDKNITDAQIPVKVCVKVFYDLETGKDFVSIFSGDPTQPALQEEIVRLTGRDVSGTYFELPDALGSIIFSSDEKNVYDGFHAQITRGSCPVS